MKFPARNHQSLLILFVSFLPFSLLAQSVTVLGNSEDARECYFSAQMAIQVQSTSRAEVKACTNALLTQGLRVRDKAATYINRGILLVALEEYQEAVRDYAMATQLYPEFGAIYVNRGNLFFLGESYKSAILEYDKALDYGLAQDHVAYLNRGMAYEKLGKLDEAEADYRQAITLAPEWHVPKSKLERVLLKIN